MRVIVFAKRPKTDKGLVSVYNSMFIFVFNKALSQPQLGFFT